MGDMGEFWKDIKDKRRELRQKFGVPCPMCIKLLPKANPKILLPGQTCRIHNFKDKRTRQEFADESIK